MDFYDASVKSEYERTIAQIPEDPFVSPSTLGVIEVLRAHFLIADFFISEQREIGGIGPKDIRLLESALHRPWIEFEGFTKWTDPIEKAATTLFGLIKNHPFMMQTNARHCYRSYIC